MTENCLGKGWLETRQEVHGLVVVICDNANAVVSMRNVPHRLMLLNS